jgi:hypothetical protein
MLVIEPFLQIFVIPSRALFGQSCNTLSVGKQRARQPSMPIGFVHGADVSNV